MNIKKLLAVLTLVLVAAAAVAAQPQPTLEFEVRSVPFKMILVEHGTFTMGGTSEQDEPWADEQPVHQVTLTRDYYIAETEVTEALWTAVTGGVPCYYPSGGNYPVEGVSWDACQDFIKKLNMLTGKKFRMPTEAEWEFAARGGNKSQGYIYSGSNNPDEVAWHRHDSNRAKHPVATKRPNELGIYDMSGNVWEWCMDGYGKYAGEPQADPVAPSSSSRVQRGGAWYHNAWNGRVSARFNNSQDNRNGSMGLRLVLVIE